MPREFGVGSVFSPGGKLVEINRCIVIENQKMIDLTRSCIVIGNETHAISPIQTRILEILFRNIGKPVSYEKLIEYAWNGSKRITKHSLYVYIHRLRWKLEQKPSRPRLLLSVHGFGYVLMSLGGIAIQTMESSSR